MVARILQSLGCLPLRLILRFFLGYQIKWADKYKNLPKPIIIIANHGTWFDPFLVIAIFSPFSRIFPIRFAAKTELFRNFIFRKLFFLVGAFPVKRKVGLENSLKVPLEILRNGGTILIFPEGRRRKIGEKPIKARRGTAYLALKTKTSILPVAIKHARGLRFRDFILRKRVKNGVKILVGQPFLLPQDLKYPDDLDKATEIISNVVANLWNDRPVRNFVSKRGKQSSEGELSSSRRT